MSLITEIDKVMKVHFNEHKDSNHARLGILKAFQTKDGSKYAEVYKETYGHSIHLYGYSTGYHPKVIGISEKSDLKTLQEFIKQNNQ